MCSDAVLVVVVVGASRRIRCSPTRPEPFSKTPQERLVDGYSCFP